jgi:segregation and condensation protein B
MELAKAISAILFYQAEPMTVKRLSTLLKHPEGEIRDALSTVATKMSDAGLCLIQNGEEVTLSTAPEAHALIEAITKEELSKDLSKAALETLAIVLYKGPITRSEIDYIRGVNSTFILRNLLVRGLVEKVENPSDQRSFLYKSTFQLLEYMGVGKIEELPDYHDAIAQLGAFVATKQEDEKAVTAESPVVSDATPVDEESADDVAKEMEQESANLAVEADIAEIDEAGGGFQDEFLEEHAEEDRNDESLTQHSPST